MTDLVESLADAVAPSEPDWDEPPAAETDRVRMNGLVWHLARVRDELSLIAVLAEAETERVVDAVNQWWDEVSEPLRAREQWLARALELSHRSELALDERRRTIKLPAGDLKATRQQPEWEIVDEAAFMAWAAEHPDLELIRQPPAPPMPAPAPDRKRMKAALTVNPNAREGDRVPAFFVDGEPKLAVPVPGIAVTIRPSKFEVIPTARPARPDPHAERIAAAEQTVAALSADLAETRERLDRRPDPAPVAQDLHDGPTYGDDDL